MSLSELISHDPCTQATVWAGGVAGPDQVEAAVRRARQGFRDWSRAPLEHRIGVARAFAALVRARRDAVAELISRETGKPFWEAKTEADSVAGKIDISIAAQAERAGVRESVTGDVVGAVRHRPHGVLAVIGPFNFPMHLPNGHIAPALLAGNAVIFKPSEKTPASGLLLADLWREAGVPAEVLQTLIGRGDVGAALATHANIDGVLFTGGVAAGQAIHGATAATPWKMLALELGGDNPLIVWDANDAESAAHLIVQSAYVSAGQRCSCARRLIVPRGEAGERLVAALVGLIDRLRVGAPFDEPAPFLGPVIDNRAADHLLAVQDRLAASGRTLRAMARIEADRPFLRPGLIDVSDAPGREGEEHFGPLLQLIRVADFEAAMAAANDTAFGLAAGLISDDEGLYRRFWNEARAGVVNWNRPTTGASSNAPFGGVGVSGNHRPSAYYAADYCAYPVAGLESASSQFRLATGVAA